jgi:NADPH:quinone reductase-like Zn-dependent oxidoreductase
VYGLIEFDRDGAAADYVMVPARDLSAKPSAVSHTVAAALPLAGLTAWQALVEHAGVLSGERVSVTGGVGGLAVQLAAQVGADVTATLRSDSGESARNLGARKVIDVRTQAFDDGEPHYEVVIGTVGGDTAETFPLAQGREAFESGQGPAGRPVRPCSWRAREFSDHEAACWQRCAALASATRSVSS